MRVIFALLLIGFSTLSYAVEQAEEIFKQLAPSLYQIRLIDKASGEKSSIGSGFQISSDGLIATNYHVISGYARHPHKYTIEYIDNQGNKAQLELKSVDVINDLAIVQRQVTNIMPYFEIAQQAPTKGEELYSLGNPHDLGMIVVPGTYNGLKNESFNDRIHFTGSVNSGMSGGPVVNKNTEVVG
ncbi:MAG: S1 family peptidase, partial [Pseudoalteromonas marina]